MSKGSFAKVAALPIPQKEDQPALSARSESFETVEPSSTADTSFSSVQLQSRPVELIPGNPIDPIRNGSSAELQRQDLAGAVNALRIDPTTSSSSTKDDGPNRDFALANTQSIAYDSTAHSSNSESSSRKPPSLDGKSIASGTTFALDEKESLRPDDSASVKAAEEEDLSLPGSRLGSETGAKAFREQLQDISERPKLLVHRGILPSRVISPSTNLSLPQIASSHEKEDHAGSNEISNAGEILSNALPPPGFTQQDPDEKLLEALESPKDRLFLLRLEQDVIDFVKDSKDPFLDLPPSNSFCRLLTHKLADYYYLTHFVESSNNSIRLYRTPYCRLPPPLTGISNPPTSGNTPPPGGTTMKIMRRGMLGRGKQSSTATSNESNHSEAPSNTGSETGGDLGSDGDRPQTKDRGSLTREEREAKYKEARERIFKGFTEKGDGEDSGGAAEDGQEVMRSASQAGKAKALGRKQKNMNDDEFQARSQFAAYYPPSEYQPPAEAPTYGRFPTQQSNSYSAHETPQLSSGNYMASQSFGNGYSPTAQSLGFLPFATQQDQINPQYPNPRVTQMFSPTPQAAMGSPGQPLGQSQFQQPSLSTAYTPDLATNMQQPYGYSQQSPPYADNSSPRTVPSIRQSPYQSPMPQYTLPLNPNSFDSTAATPEVPYAYGQLPTPYSQRGQRPRNDQHPIPGSFNRNAFSPHSQTFVPGMGAVGSPKTPAFTPVHANNTAGSYNRGGNVPMPSNGHGPPSYPAGRPGFSPLQAPYTGARGPTQATPSFGNGRVEQGYSAPKPAQPPAQSSLPKWNNPPNLPPKPPAPAGFPQPSQPYATALKTSLPGYMGGRSNGLGNSQVQPQHGGPNVRGDARGST